jgi:hypothetical protein
MALYTIQQLRDKGWSDAKIKEWGEKSGKVAGIGVRADKGTPPRDFLRNQSYAVERTTVYNEDRTERTLVDGRVQRLQRNRQGSTWVTVSGFRAGEQRVVGASDPNSGGTHRVRVGMTFETRQGYDREYDPIGYSYYSVYGRAPTIAERHQWGDPDVGGSGKPNGRWDTHYNVKDIMLSLAASDEGRRAGADLGYYGVREVDPATLPGSYRPFYDVWRQRNPGRTLSSIDLLEFRKAKNQGNVAAYEARLRGDIRDVYHPTERYEDGSPILVTYITPDAARNSGDNRILLTGSKRGQLYYGDLGSINIKRFSNIGGGEPDQSGMYFGYTKGSARGGLIGGDFAEFMEKNISSQMKFLVGGLGLWGGALFGQEFAEDATRGGAQMTGASVEDIQTAQKIGQEIAAAATAFIPGVGIFISAGIRSLAAANNAITYGTSMSAGFAEAGKGFITDAFTVGVASGFNAANKANAAYQAAAKSALDAGATAAQAARMGTRAIALSTRLAQGAITGVTRGVVSGAMASEGRLEKNIAFGAATGAVGGAISTGVSASFNSAAEALAGTSVGDLINFSSESAFASALVRGGSNAVSSYANQAFRYSIDDQYRKQVKAAVAQGAFKDTEDFFFRQSIGSAALGAYQGYKEAGGPGGFGETLGDLVKPPEDGKYFSDFGWQGTPVKRYEPSFIGPPEKDLPKVPTFRQVFLGEDNKFSFGAAFSDAGEGGYNGILESLVEASILTLGASFALGAINPREGFITPRMEPYSGGGSTYGGRIQQAYGGFGYGGGGGGAAGPAPAGSQVIADIAAGGGFG